MDKVVATPLLLFCGHGRLMVSLVEYDADAGAAGGAGGRST